MRGIVPLSLLAASGAAAAGLALFAAFPAAVDTETAPRSAVTPATADAIPADPRTATPVVSHVGFFNGFDL